MINTLSRYAYNDPALQYTQTAAPVLIRHERGIASTEHLWPQGSTLNISLFDMPDKAKEYIKKNINLWQPYTNLKFNFINTNDGDIRISAKDDGTGNWSVIGTQAKQKPLHEPTLHIDLMQTADLGTHSGCYMNTNIRITTYSGTRKNCTRSPKVLEIQNRTPTRIF